MYQRPKLWVYQIFWYFYDLLNKIVSVYLSVDIYHIDNGVI